MSDPLLHYTNGAGGHLRFTVDLVECRISQLHEHPEQGTTVLIFVTDEQILGLPVPFGVPDMLLYSVAYGRPKGFGQVLWQEQGKTRVMYTPFMEDEVYFKDDKTS